MKRILQKNREYSLFSVIPSEIIEDMGLKAGDKLDFCIEGDYIKVTPVHTAAKQSVPADTPTVSEGISYDKLR